MKEMVLECITNYEELTAKNNIDLTFVTTLFTKNVIICEIDEDFDHGLDH